MQCKQIVSRIVKQINSDLGFHRVHYTQLKLFKSCTCICFHYHCIQVQLQFRERSTNHVYLGDVNDTAFAYTQSIHFALGTENGPIFMIFFICTNFRLKYVV